MPSEKKCDRPNHIQRIPGLLTAALDTAQAKSLRGFIHRRVYFINLQSAVLRTTPD